MSRVTPRRGFTGAVLGALTVVLVGSGGVCRPARAAVASTHSADWKVAVTPAVGIGGLDAEHQVIVTNLGPDEATNVQISDLLSSVTPSGGKEHMLSATSSQGTCSDTVRPATDLVNCQIGNVAAGQTVTVTVDTKMPPDANTGFASHLGEVRPTRGAPTCSTCRQAHSPPGRRDCSAPTRRPSRMGTCCGKSASPLPRTMSFISRTVRSSGATAFWRAPTGSSSSLIGQSLRSIPIQRVGAAEVVAVVEAAPIRSRT